MNVRTVQRALKSLGFDPGPSDGIWGRNTSAAVSSFQQSHNLPPTGLIDQRTEREILSLAGTPADTSALVWLEEARRLMGLREVTGGGSNPTILEWAKDLDISYPGDDIPWCGLFAGHCIAATLPNERLPNNPLGARQWLKFGTKVDPVVGAVLVFWRVSKDGGLGHVGFYDSEDSEAYHLLAGNQSDRVNVARVAKSRLLGARWPASAGSLISSTATRAGSGDLSRNEA